MPRAKSTLRLIADNIPTTNSGNDVPNATNDIPIIASGGAGTTDHFVDAFKIGKADAALAASVFHYGEIKIPDLKKKLKQENIEIRITNENS